MNWTPIWAIVHKDLSTVVRNRGVRTPLLITPVIILVVLPVMLVGGGEILSNAAVPGMEDAGGSALGAFTSPEAQARATGLPPGPGRWAVYVLEVFLAPLFLLVPLIVATVIAADSFAGERERGTLEALLHTPTTDEELLTAKFLAAWLPAVTVAWVGFAFYSVLANALAYPLIGFVFFPSATWLLLAFWVTPAVAALGLGIMVIASSRVQSLQAAHQIGSLVVLPIVLLLIAQITGLLLLGPAVVTIMGATLWAAAAGFIATGARTLRRQQLAARL